MPRGPVAASPGSGASPAPVAGPTPPALRLPTVPAVPIPVAPRESSAADEAPWPGGPPHRPPRVLTVAEAMELALKQNATLKTVQAQEKEAYWAYKMGVSLPSASVAVNYSGGNNTTPTNAGVVPDYSVSVSQSFGPIRSIALTGKTAFQAWQIAQATTRQTRITLVQNVKDAFYGLLLAQEQLAVARENQALARRILETAQKRFDAGASPRMDLLNAQIQQATSEQAAIQAMAALKQARTTLDPVLGLRADEVIEARGDHALPSLPLVFATLEQVAQQTSPQVEIATKTLEQSRTQVQLARSQANPTPSLFYSYDLRVTPLYVVGATISFPLDWGQIRNSVRQQIATVQEKEHALDSARLAVSSSVKSAFDAYQAALLNLGVYREKVLQPTEQLMTMTQFGYSQGALPFLQVLNAEQTLRTARSQYYSLQLSGRQALDALEAAVGRVLEGDRP